MLANYGILLVDDEPAYHAMVAALLQGLPVVVDYAADRAEALRKISTGRYDLILMDIQLGDDDGRQVAAAIRAADGGAGRRPVLAFTNIHPAEGERYFFDHGFDGWIAKPFEGRTLIATVRRWLGDAEDSGEMLAGGEQLASLLGEEGAAMMIARLHANLAEAVAAIDAGADARPIGHRMGGLSGTLGFPALSAAWLSLQDDRATWPTVRALTMEAIARSGTGPAVQDPGLHPNPS
ncbi:MULTISPECIES: response regulator [unclassified Sphingomonas]|uniref:response regulator n=1 Tax=unclassified Sphingomonas TaxID=196159 RepID=UPI0006F67DE8|nr:MULTISPECIES: response regulator [unclassified Sphingomonas]KQX20310.1 response regulator receiver protein [Sphingomonas sp. Root1294]KQY67560.1 response regulator receiver protein [Sphingomonas sp. Root50]KRB91368.1 response regulator receiver protein [Sphingomonas sp. Root720]